MEGQEVLGVENPVRGEAYSEWFQSRFKGFDCFLGTSLKGLENQATTFLLAVEFELHRRAASEKKSRDLKSSGMKGLNEAGKRLQIRNLLRAWRPDIVYLQETKLEWITRGVVKSIWSCPYVNWLYLGSEGASGGIVLMWDRRAMEKVEEAVGRFSVSCRFKNIGDQFAWAFIGLYGPNSNKRRRKMWEELIGLISWWDVPWCLGGDFNIIRFPSERLGATTSTRAMYEFSDFISLYGLMDILMEGGLYTWSNNSSASRIDRFLFSSLLADHFTLFAQRRLPKASYVFQGKPSFILAKKLAALKLDIKKWNEIKFGNVTLKKQLLWKKLNDLDVREETQPLIVEEKLEQVNLCTKIEKLTLLEEISWRQKSRMLHLREGDASTNFFHRMANSNRRNNGIESLMVNGTLSFDQGMIADCITQIFMNLYSEQQVVRPFPEVLVFPRISGDNADWLDRPFEEAEIFDVIQNFNGDKAPGPDGFPMAFFGLLPSMLGYSQN
ncbi:uncharacterized protein LOC126719218 [Quercus robur]|uniref:uncharacterized protein LOC126719218 n=1 Tax=Quercus robur TaxID=38942 RepID=UPI0021625D86|nr:uncharacterized protein LOC126719218 [Quercus robur]